MPPTTSRSPYDVALNQTVSSSRTKIIPYTHGLTGVNLKVNDITTQGLWFSVATLAVLVLIARLAQCLYRRFRLIVTIHLTKDQHQYWARDSSFWSKIKKNLLQAPLLHRRHNKETQLSSAISVGTLPSRLHSLLLGAFLISNIIYCVILDYHGQSKAALIAELRGRSGHLALINMLILILFAARNNPLIPILSVSFDTFNLFHRWIGRIIVLESLVHIVAWFVNNEHAIGYNGIKDVLMTDTFAQCGLAAAIALLVIIVQSPGAIRHAFYEVFLVTHQILAIVILGATATHVKLHNLPQKPIIYTIIGIWASERVMRILRTIYYNVSYKGVTKVRVEALKGGACRVTFAIRRPFVTAPGHHIYAYIPSISFWMSHPFSVAMVSNKEPVLEYTPGPSPCPSILSGVEKISRQAEAAPSYSISCIMAARTGMTRKLYNKARSSPEGVYTCRAFIEGPYGAADSLDSYGTVLLFAGGVGITNQISHMHHLIQGWAASTNATQKLILVWSVRSFDQLEWARPWLEQLSRLDRNGRDLEIITHVTQLRSVDESIRPQGMQIYPGRANVDRLVENQFEERIGAMTIGVCGPGALADDVRKAAREVMTRGKVDFWEEAFTW
ncbi:MAG: hypothetical protein Q9195_006557 [Heterodermia aff. obscurata]